MALESSFRAINGHDTADDLFDWACDFFCSQGFSGVVYVTPESAAGPYVIRQCGMPAEWMAHYEGNALHEHDPLPGIAFRHGKPMRLAELIAKMPSLNTGQKDFMEQFRKSSGLKDGFVIPAFGPFGRPGLIGLVNPVHPALLDQIDLDLLTAIAQQVHTRMEHLEVSSPTPSLSPREREILGWLVKGKSVSDIATILDLKVPTIATHLQRIYAKMGVNDRVSCVAKALSWHYA